MSEVGVGVGGWESALSSSVIVYFVSVVVYIEKKKKRHYFLSELCNFSGVKHTYLSGPNDTAPSHSSFTSQ